MQHDDHTENDRYHDLRDRAVTDDGRPQFAMVPESVIFNDAISPGAVRAFAALMRYVNTRYAAGDWEAFPGLDGLAERLGITRNGLTKQIRELERAGLVEVVHRYRPDGGRKSNSYRLSAWGGFQLQREGGLQPPLEHNESHNERENPDTSSQSSEVSRPLTLGEQRSQDLCDRLAGRISELTGREAPTVTKAWLDSARLLIDRDGRDPEEVAAAIDWVTRHHFWQRNVLSMRKLRQHFERLDLEARSEKMRVGRERRQGSRHSGGGLMDTLAQMDAEEDAGGRGAGS